MSVYDRIFAQDTAVVAIYGDAALPSTPPTLLLNLLTVFRECSIKVNTEADEGAATSSRTSRKLPYRERWTVSLGAVVDITLASLLSIYQAYGPGPYWIWVQTHPGDPASTHYSFVTRAVIIDAGLGTSGEEYTQTGVLETIQEWQPYGSTNKIG